jgi:glycosyltransferase involved in cell wall biosynthesis
MKPKKLCLYYIKTTEPDRWFKGDQKLRAMVRRLFKKKQLKSSLEIVFENLCLGLQKINIEFEVNKPFNQLSKEETVVILGRGTNCLQGYNQPNKIIAGIGLMSHPSEWPTLFKQYPVVAYLQHSDWALKPYQKIFGIENCYKWPAGIDTNYWMPESCDTKDYDFLVYEKFLWHRDKMKQHFMSPILTHLKKIGKTFKVISYGNYEKQDYLKLLLKSRAMIFLCEHESQGLAYQEALSTGVPIFAWDNGEWLDPMKFVYGEEGHTPASSVPFFDSSCGLTFKNLDDFYIQLPDFFNALGNFSYNPRNFVLENLSLEVSANKFMNIVNHVIKQ